jgi:NADPH:quinone reductase-like Zn-dependent oxidoreductase
MLAFKPLVESGGASDTAAMTTRAAAPTATDKLTMRAIVQEGRGGPEILQVATVPRPAPLPTEVLVRVHAAGINPVDWKTREGNGTAAMTGESPRILGWDVSGVVEEVGFGVTTLAVGDEVFGMPWFPREAGGYAEFVTAPSRQFARKPAAISHEEAAAIPLAGLTAWQTVVDTAAVASGQRVLVHAAAGGVGHLAVQIAKSRGAYVIGTASAARHTWLRELGVDELVDYNEVRFEEAVADVDVVIDLVGDAHGATSTRSLEVLRPGGLLVAVPAGVSPELAAAAQEHGVRVTPFLVEPDGAALGEMADLINLGKLRIEVERVYDLDDVAEAHRQGETDRTRGKLVLRMGRDR